MKTSPAGLLFVAKWEGEVDHVYKDVAGVLTIGFGHALKAGDGFSPTSTLTHQQALDLLAHDVSWAEDAVNGLVKVPMTQNQFDALVDFTFNCGSGALARSAVLSELNAGNAPGAAAHFPDWAHAMEGGKLVVDQGLLRRRMSEQRIFLTPDAPAIVPPAPPSEDPVTKVDPPDQKS